MLISKHLLRCSVLLCSALMLITLMWVDAPSSEAAPFSQTTPTGIEFQVQRIIPTVAAGPTEALRMLPDDQRYAFPPYHLITTDRNGEALLQAELNGQVCSIYVFQHTTLLQNFVGLFTGETGESLVQRSCPRESAGNTICTEEGAAVFNACANQLIRTPGAPSTLCNGSLYNPADVRTSLYAPSDGAADEQATVGRYGLMKMQPPHVQQTIPAAQEQLWCPCMVHVQRGWVFTAYMPEIELTLVIPFEGEATVDFISSTVVPGEHFALFYNPERLQIPGFAAEQPYTFDRLQELTQVLSETTADLIPWLCRTRGHARADNVLFPVLEFLDASPSADRLNLRTGPGTTYSIIGRQARGAGVNVMGKNTVGSWLQVHTTGGQTGWMAAWLSEICIDLEDVPVVSFPPPPPPPPPPTATRFISPLPTPTFTMTPTLSTEPVTVTLEPPTIATEPYTITLEPPTIATKPFTITLEPPVETETVTETPTETATETSIVTPKVLLMTPIETPESPTDTPEPPMDTPEPPTNTPEPPTPDF